MSARQQAARALRGVAWRLDRSPKFRVRQQPATIEDGAESSGSVGSRKASLFFEQYPRFYWTSGTASDPSRLNLRYEAIFGENRDIFDGVSVLDLASHDGRWSLAALETGARSVIGIEARPELVQRATDNLTRYGYGPDRVRFVTGDAHGVLNREHFDVRVVLCLGFLYHTLRYNELLEGVRRTNARHLLIDTFSPQMMAPLPNVNVITEPAAQTGKAVSDTYSHGPAVLVGRPNLAAIRTIIGAYGYRVERLSDWDALLRDNPETKNCRDYANHRRITIRCILDDAIA